MKSNYLLVGLCLLVGALLLAACGGGVPPAQSNTSAPAQATATTAPATPASQPTAAAPTATPEPFTAELRVVGMYPGMGPTNPNTGRPAGIQTHDVATYTLYSPGTRNVPPGVPVYLEPLAFGIVKDAKVASYEWTMDKIPSGSAAKLAKNERDVPGLTLDMQTFTPDKEGEYLITVTAVDDKGNKSIAGELTVVAAKYVGAETCKTCHAKQYEGWSKTKHGNVFKDFVNENAEGEYFSVGFGCARCHTTGYYQVKPSTGGWWDMFTQVNGLKWDDAMKTAIATNAFNEEEGKDSFSTLFPANVQAVSNIGCESCHGPASAHVAAPSKETAPMPRSDASSCNQCHNASGHHTRGGAFANSPHSNSSELEEGSNPSCARCHSPQGFIDTINGVAADKVRAVNDDFGCSICHDPHAEDNPFQLRAVDTANIPETPKDSSFTVEGFGLSALCVNCHNARREAAIVDDPTQTRFTPHASNAAELLTGRGGYDWGVKLQNSFHVNIGKGVMNDEHSNQPGNMDFTQMNGGAAPGPCVMCHMYRTPGGVWDTKDSMAVPGHQQIGGHTFSMRVEQDGKEVQHTEACQLCHTGVTSFNFPSSADYDGNGKVEGVQDEVKGLKAALQAAILGWKDAAGKSPTLNSSGTGFVTTGLTLTTDIKAAIYNYSFANDSSGTHNFARTVGLLQVSVAKISGKDVPNAVLLYSK